jgi:hypothetical protein
MYLTGTVERKYLITFFINLSESTKTNFRPLNEFYKSLVQNYQE